MLRIESYLFWKLCKHSKSELSLFSVEQHDSLKCKSLSEINQLTTLTLLDSNKVKHGLTDHTFHFSQMFFNIRDTGATRHACNRQITSF